MLGSLVRLLRAQKLYVALVLVILVVTYHLNFNTASASVCDSRRHGICNYDGNHAVVARSLQDSRTLVVVVGVEAFKNDPNFVTRLSSFASSITTPDQLEERSVVLELWVDEAAGQHDTDVPSTIANMCQSTLSGNCFIVASTSHARFVQTVATHAIAFLALSVPMPKTQLSSDLNVPVVLASANMIDNLQWIGQLSRQMWKHWNTPKISISVTTQSRAASLRRLTKSLVASEYLGDDVSLTFAVDHSIRNRDVLHVCSTLRWPHGRVSIRHRVQEGGLISAVVESWYPSNEHEYGAIFEDDISVSPLWYIYAKYNILHYRYGEQDEEFRAHLSGLSLYTPRVSEAKLPRETIDFAKRIAERQFLLQWPCSWGSVFFPEHWREFHVFMAARRRFAAEATRSTEVTLDIPGSATNSWKSSWKRYFIEMMYSRGYTMIYPNFANQTSFSTNHLEAGAHVLNPKGSQLHHSPADYTVQLFGVESFDKNQRSIFAPAAELKLAALPVFNMFSSRSNLPDLIEVGKAWNHDIVICGAGQIRTVDSLGYLSCASPMQ